eukprot:894816-Amphidinium_carterae.1
MNQSSWIGVCLTGVSSCLDQQPHKSHQSGWIGVCLTGVRSCLDRTPSLNQRGWIGVCLTVVRSCLNEKAAAQLNQLVAAGTQVALQREKELKLDGQSQKEDRKVALNAALGGLRHEERAHSAFQVGDTCVRCGEGVENLEHIVHHRPHWNKERRESGMPSHAPEAPACAAAWSLTGPSAGCPPSP